MAVEEVDPGTFLCAEHGYQAAATQDPDGTGEVMIPAGPQYDRDCPDCQRARRLAVEHARGDVIEEESTGD